MMCQQDDAPGNIVSSLSNLVVMSSDKLPVFPANYFKERLRWLTIVLYFHPDGCKVVMVLASAQINTCNGYYCDGFKANTATKPAFWTEDWNGW